MCEPQSNCGATNGMRELDDIRQNVADHARQAGAVAVKGVKVGAAGAGTRLKSGFGYRLERDCGVRWNLWGRRLKRAGCGFICSLRGPAFALPLILCGAISLVSGLYGAVFSAEGTSKVSSPAVAVAGLGMLIASMPSVLTGFGFDVADADGFAARLVQRLAVPLAAVVLVGGGGWLFGNGYAPSGLNGAPAWIGSVVGGLSSQPPVEGKAMVLAGDMFRLNGAVYKLAGVKSPDPQQVCERDAGAPRNGNVARRRCLHLKNSSAAGPFAVSATGGRILSVRSKPNVRLQARM